MLVAKDGEDDDLSLDMQVAGFRPCTCSTNFEAIYVHHYFK